MMNREYIREGERLDDLQIKGYGIIQNPESFCFGMDAVLLSSFAKVKPHEHVLDLGTGTGILPILLEAKKRIVIYGTGHVGHKFYKVLKQNGLEKQIDVVEGDIRKGSELFGAASFQVITVNPPYMIGEHGLKNENEALYIARHEVLCTLEDVLRESARLLVPKGRFYMVHRPFRLPEILAKMSAYGIEPKRMRMVHPFVDKEPNMVLIEGLRGGKPRMKVEPPLIVYQRDGSYTEEVLRIYNDE